MKILIPKEAKRDETRVSGTPSSVKDLKALGLEVMVESGAGLGSKISDEEYKAAGANVKLHSGINYSDSSIVVSINPPQRQGAGRNQLDMLKAGAIWISQFWPHLELDALKKAVKNKITLFSLTLMPRISRAQKMDVLSSQSNLAGYKAVIIAAQELPKIFPLMMTAAGTIKPAKVVVIGAGVAGLQAVATAKRLGAQVEVSDIRPAVKEQVESLGAKFIEVVDEQGSDSGGYAKEASEDFKRRQAEELKKRIAAADVVITTALIPGRGAPKIVTEEMVKLMKDGSVIVDLASEMGGNCAYTKPGARVKKNGVLIIGDLNLPGTIPLDSSQVFAKNISAFVQLLVKDGKIIIDKSDEVIAGCLVTLNGEPYHKNAIEALGGKK